MGIEGYLLPISRDPLMSRKNRTAHAWFTALTCSGSSASGLAWTSVPPRLMSPQRAARLHGAADACFEKLGEALDPDLSSVRIAHHLRLRRTMGDSAFEADYRSGSDLAPQSVIDPTMQEPIID
jgi:hypothetical protein